MRATEPGAPPESLEEMLRETEPETPTDEPAKTLEEILREAEPPAGAPLPLTPRQEEGAPEAPAAPEPEGEAEGEPPRRAEAEPPRQPGKPRMGLFKSLFDRVFEAVEEFLPDRLRQTQ